MKKYLKFIELNQKQKRITKWFTVYNEVTKDDIGEIKWNGAWRQYCFYPDYSTHWARGCLKEIVEFMEELMEQTKTTQKTSTTNSQHIKSEGTESDLTKV